MDLERLERAPDVTGRGLVAVDATDRLLLDTCDPVGPVAVVEDGYGALALSVAERGLDVRVFQDGLLQERAFDRNAERLGVTGWTRGATLAATVTGARTVLLRLPRSSAYAEEAVATVAALADPDVTLYAGARLKHLAPGVTEPLRTHFAEVQGTLARQKSRVLVATGARPTSPPGPHPGEHDRLRLRSYGAVFAGARADLGTRALLEAVEPGLLTGTVLDLGCGSGLLAAYAARAGAPTVLATDTSAAAVASTLATAEANGFAVDARRTDGAEGIEDATVDTVLCNPPFHTGPAVHDGLAERLFRDGARVLRPGGHLIAVFNNHLPYVRALDRLVGRTRVVRRSGRFLVTLSTRR